MYKTFNELNVNFSSLELRSSSIIFLTLCDFPFLCVSLNLSEKPSRHMCQTNFNYRKPFSFIKRVKFFFRCCVFLNVLCFLNSMYFKDDTRKSLRSFLIVQRGLFIVGFLEPFTVSFSKTRDL